MIWYNLPDNFLSFAIARKLHDHSGLVLIVAPNTQTVEKLQQELSFYNPSIPLHHFS